MSDLTLATVDDLARARHATDLGEVRVVAAAFTLRNMLPHALKYALWALRPGGRLILDDAGSAAGFDTAAFTVTHPQVRQWAFKLLGDAATLVEIDAKVGRIVFERSVPVLPSGWSAGIVFSGNDDEVPKLIECLQALARQPELARAAGGEIIVCGPDCAVPFLADWPEVEYLVHATETRPRLMITAKKNALMARMKGPRLAVLHTRILLGDGCLAAVPREFDIVSPRVQVVEGAGLRDYLCLQAADAAIPGQMPRRAGDTVRRVGVDDYLSLYARGVPFVDGGVFFTTKAVAARCPLDERLAWGEAEDVDWCARAQLDGFLVDLVPEALAVSSTNKLGNTGRLPAPVARLVRAALRPVRWTANGARHRLRTLTG